MDDIRFVFEGKDTEELLREANYKVRMRNRWLWGLVFLLCGLVLAAMGYLYWKQYPLLAGGWTAIYGIYLLLHPLLAAKRIIHHERKQGGGQTPLCTVTIADKVEFACNDNLMVIQFADMKEVHFLNRGLILKGGDWIFTFDRRNMTGGSMMELEEYLREKCKNAEFYHKESKKFREETK